MMGLKRNLFPEVAEFSVMMNTSTARRGERGFKSDRRKRKRNVTMAANVISGDSLGAIAPNEKENALPTKTRKATRQVKEAHNNKQQDIQNHEFKPSVLMGLGVMENVSNKNLPTRSTRQQIDNSGKNSKIMKNRRMLSSQPKSVLVCFDNDNRSGSTARIKGKAKTTKTTRKQANELKKTMGKRLRQEEAVSNGDSLMTCLVGNSSMPTKSKTTKTKLSQKQVTTAIQGKTRKKTGTSKDQSQVKSTEALVPTKKSQPVRKRPTATLCNVGGLGAFVGIMGNTITNENPVEGSCDIRRMVSPIENDLKNKSRRPSKLRKKPKKQKSTKKSTKRKRTEKEKKPEIAASELHEIPSMIILSLPQQIEQSQMRLSLDTTMSSISTKWKLEEKGSEEKPAAGSSSEELMKSMPSSEVHPTIIESSKTKAVKKDGSTIKDQDRNNSVEQKAPPRRSRRRSHEPVRLLDEAQSSTSIEIQESDSSTSFRRSKRRKSQPVRLIDLDESETRQAPKPARSKKATPKNTGSKRTSRSKKKPEIEKKPKCIPKEKPPEVKEVKEAVTIENTNKPNMNRCTSSPSTRDKEQFDDALKAVMPPDDTEQLQDDIFNSTPMRTLFAKSLSASDETKMSDQCEEKIKQKERRSRRKSIEPERYGYETESATNSSTTISESSPETIASKKSTASDSETKSSKQSSTSISKKVSTSKSASKSSKKHPKSAMKKSKRKTKGSLKAKKRVRISLDAPTFQPFS